MTQDQPPTESAIMQSNSPPTLSERILALPQELIDIIHTDFESDKNEPIPYNTDIIATCDWRIPSILQVNRALRTKYRQAYYLRNRFEFLDSATYQGWINAMSSFDSRRMATTSYSFEYRGVKYVRTIRYSRQHCWYNWWKTVASRGSSGVKVWWEVFEENDSMRWT